MDIPMSETDDVSHVFQAVKECTTHTVKVRRQELEKPVQKDGIAVVT